MKSIEAAMIMPLVLILFCLSVSCCLVVYVHSAKFSRQYLEMGQQVRDANEMLKYDFKQLELNGLKVKNIGQRKIKLLSFNCRGNAILELVYFVKDEISEFAK